MKKGFTLFEALIAFTISVTLMLTGYVILKRTVISFDTINNFQDDAYSELKDYYKVMNFFKTGEFDWIDYNKDEDSDYFILRLDYQNDYKEMKIVYNDAIYLNDEKVNLIPLRVEADGPTVLVYVKNNNDKSIICLRGIS